MARYTTTQEFSFGEARDYRVLVVQGEVNINTWDGEAYVLAENVTTSVNRMFSQGMKIEVEVVSGSFYIDESEV